MTKLSILESERRRVNSGDRQEDNLSRLVLLSFSSISLSFKFYVGFYFYSFFIVILLFYFVLIEKKIVAIQQK